MTKLGQLIAVITIVLATVGVLSMTGKLNLESEKNNLTNGEQKELHGEVIYTYGDVYKKRNDELIKIKNGEIINEGDILKTNSESKLSILFDDGSVIRLSDNTEIEIKDIKKEIILINEIAGTTYNRVAKADNREYSILYNDIKTTALGTIFIVDVKNDEIKVQVLESKVQLSYKDGTQKVEEGQKITINTKTDTLNKENVIKTELDADKFINWNKEEDKKEIIKQTDDDKKEGEENNNEEVVEEDDEGEEENNDEVSEEEEVVVTQPKPVVKTYPISLNISGTKANWSTNNYYSKGYKLIWSKNSNPTYPTRSGDKYGYYSNPNTTEGSLTAFNGTGNYYVRVCEYLGGKCGAYSNQVKVYLTTENVKTRPETSKVKSLNLKMDGKTANWTIDGFSAKGYKLVWSKNASPTYPTRSGDKYSYHSNPNTNSSNIYAFDGEGKYYVRVCEYLGGKCGIYSNQVTITLE